MILMYKIIQGLIGIDMSIFTFRDTPPTTRGYQSIQGFQVSSTLVSRSQTLFSRRGAIAFSISAPLEAGRLY